MSFPNPSSNLYMNHPSNSSNSYGHYQPQPSTMSTSTSDPQNQHHPLFHHHHHHHPSVFQPASSAGPTLQHHSGMVAAPNPSTTGYSSSYSSTSFQRPSDSYSSSLNLEDPNDSSNRSSIDNPNRASSSSSSNSQPTSPSYPPGMNPNEHRKSSDSAADIKHRRRTTKSQFQILENTFQRDFKPTSQTRQQLAAQLGMEPRAVQIWFQNRRAKAKATAKRDEAIARGDPIEFPVHGGKVSDRAPKSRAVLASLMKRAEAVKEARRLSESQQGGEAGSSSRERGEPDELEDSDDEDNAKLQRHLAATRASTGSSLISPTSSTFSDRSHQDGGYNSASTSVSHLPTLTSLYDSGSTPYRFGTAQTHIPGLPMGGAEEDGRSRSSTGGNSNDFSNSSAWQSRRPSAMSTLSTSSTSSNPSYMSATSYGNPSSSMLLQQPPPGNSYGRLAPGDSYSNINMAGAGAMHYHSSSYPSYSSLPQMAAAQAQGHPYGQPDFSAYPPAARYRSFPNVFPGSVQHLQQQQHLAQQNQPDQDLNDHSASVGANPNDRAYTETAQYPSNFDAEIRRVSCPDTFSAFSNLLPLQGMFLNQDPFNSNEQEEEDGSNPNIGFNRKEDLQQLQCQDFIQNSNSLQFPSHPAYDMSSCISFNKTMRGGKSLNKSADQQQQQQQPLSSSGNSQDTETGEEFLEDSEMNDDQDEKELGISETDRKIGMGRGPEEEEENEFFNPDTPSFDGSSLGHDKVGSESSVFSNISTSTSSRNGKDVQSPSPITSHSVMTPTDV